MINKVNVAGTEVAYRVDGQGPGLVLIHGTGGDSMSHWGHLVEQFSHRWTVVRPDFSGSGETEDGGGEISIELLAAQVVGAAQAAGVVPFDLVGFSLGATVAAYIAAEYPDVVSSVVLLAGFAHATDSRMQLQCELWRDLAKKDPESMIRLMLLSGMSVEALTNLSKEQIEVSVKALVDGTRWEGFIRQLDMVLSLDIRDKLQKIRKPTLVIGCQHDQMAPNSHAQALAKIISHALYVELESGHFAPVECPALLAETVRKFLLTFSV